MIPSSPPGDPGVMADPALGRLLKKSGDYLARLDGDVLVVSRGAKLRGVCLKCGSHHQLTTRRVRFRLLRFAALLPTVKSTELAVALCASCNERWNAARQALAVSITLFVASLIGLSVFGSPHDPHALVPLCFVALVAVLVVGFAFARPRMLNAKRIDDRFVEILGCHANAAQEIAEGSIR